MLLAIAAYHARAQEPPRPDAAVIEEIEREQVQRHTNLLASQPELAREFRDANVILTQTRERIAAGNLDEALGEEELVTSAQGAPTVSRDARASELAFVVDTYARLGDDDLSYAVTLWELADACVQRNGRGDADRALRYVVPALRGMEKGLRGRQYRGYVLALDTYAKALLRRGRADAAVDAYERALKANLALDGKNDRYAGLENSLGEAYRELGKHGAQARDHLGAAEAWLRAARARGDTPLLRAAAAVVYGNLSLLASDEGDFDAARAEALKAKALHELLAADVKGTPDERWAELQHALCLRQLASLSLMDRPRLTPAERNAQATEAEGYLKQAVTLVEAARGANDPMTVITRLTLGLLYANRGDDARAIEQVKACAGVPEADDPQLRLETYRLWTAIGLNAQQYDIALEAALKWLDLAHQAPGDPDLVGGVHFALAQTYDATGQTEKAEAEFKVTLTGSHRSMELAFASAPERRQLAAERTLRTTLDAYLSFKAVQGWPGRGGYEQVLAWKGSVFTHQAAIGRARASTDPATVALFTQLETGTQQVAALVFEQGRDRRPVLDDPAWRVRAEARAKQIEAANADMDRCLELLAQCGGREAARADVAALQKALPREAALVDFLEYVSRPRQPRRGEVAKFEPRYVAYVIRHDKVIPIDLGPAAPIDMAVASWTKDKCADAKVGLEVRQLIWDKLSPALDGAKVILVSPDAAISNLPFGALPDADGRYLIERYAFASIPVPQLLPALLKPAAAAGGSALVVSAEVPVQGRPVIATRGSPWAGVPRLAHAAAEVADVRQRFDARMPNLPVQALFGPDATKTELRRAIASATYLHYAGHAFFAPELRRAIESQHAAPPNGEDAVPAIDPSLLCGLVLAPGANDDGALTAYEIARMDLRKLNLAVLSGCDTAVGESAGGEGLLSLQRACHVAGARTVVASLWPVSDDATERLMKSFYADLFADPQHPALPLVALRRAQLKVMHEPPPAERHTVSVLGEPDAGQPAVESRRPPAYWAPWILSGAPGDLDELIREVASQGN